MTADAPARTARTSTTVRRPTGTTRLSSDAPGKTGLGRSIISDRATGSGGMSKSVSRADAYLCVSDVWRYGVEVLMVLL